MNDDPPATTGGPTDAPRARGLSAVGGAIFLIAVAAAALSMIALLRRNVPQARVTPQTGGVEFKTQPPGATVLFDGKFVGISPVRLSGVEQGRHVLKLEKSGYHVVRETVGISAGDE